jgi:hypothetical protein
MNAPSDPTSEREMTMVAESMKTPRCLALLMAGVLISMMSTLAGAATTVLDPGPGTDYLSVSCGGQTVNEVATGFDAAGNAATQVRVATTCHGSGRGSPNQYYLACWAVTFGEDGAIQSRVWQATNHWVQGNPAIPCPVVTDPAAVYNFTDGAGHFPATLSTGRLGSNSTAYRAVLETTCTPIKLGDTVAGTIGAPGETTCYSFSGAGGDVVQVGTVVTSGPLVAEVEVFGPDGNLLCGPGSGALECALAASGRQIARIGDSTGTGTGGYNLSLTCLSPACLPFDYALGNSGPIAAAPGASGFNTITATLSTGAPENVTFSVSGLPAGASASFGAAGCTPTCTSDLTIATSESTPLGIYPITVTGDPLGRSTIFSLVVSNGACPARTALASSPDQAGAIGDLHAFRDQVLLRSTGGRHYVKLFYKHAPEAVTLMLRDPDLRARSLALMQRLLPDIQSVIEGNAIRLTPDETASIDSLLQAFASGATPGLRTDIDAVRRDLQQGTLLRNLGIPAR